MKVIISRKELENIFQKYVAVSQADSPKSEWQWIQMGDKVVEFWFPEHVEVEIEAEVSNGK